MIEVVRVKDELSPQIIQFASNCVQETKLDSLGVKLDSKVFIDTLFSFATDPKKVFFIAKSNGEAIGTIFGEINVLAFTSIPIIVECYFRVREDFRGYGVAKMLVKAFEDWGKEQGCEVCVFGVNHFASTDPSLANSFLTNGGYIHYGTSYFKRI